MKKQGASFFQKVRMLDTVDIRLYSIVNLQATQDIGISGSCLSAACWSV